MMFSWLFAIMIAGMRTAHGFNSDMQRFVADSGQQPTRIDNKIRVQLSDPGDSVISPRQFDHNSRAIYHPVWLVLLWFIHVDLPSKSEQIQYQWLQQTHVSTDFF